jgi:heat shock protein HtpX
MNQVKTVALLATLSALLITISYSVFGGVMGVTAGIALAALTNLGAWYYSDRLILTTYQAQPVTPEQAPDLHRMVARLAEKANIPQPAVYVLPNPAANAFATGRDPEHAAIAVTQGILDLLPADELEGVIAHELTHVINRDTLTQAVAATIAGAISFLAQMLSYSLWFGGSRDEDGPSPLALLATVLLAPVAATVIQLGISRTREFSADAGAAELTGNPLALASALRRLDNRAQQVPMGGNPAFAPLMIVNAPAKQLMARLFSTHPSTEQRVERLTSMPVPNNTAVEL